MKTCAFTGHRPQNLPFGFRESDPHCQRLKQVLREQIVRAITEGQVTRFISGMAAGVDMYASEIVLELREKDPRIFLECAIPCETQTLRWPEELCQRYRRIVRLCDKETLLQKPYTRDCMQKRNRYMVDHADILLAVWNGTPGGTGSTVRYALSCRKRVCRIDPVTLQVKLLQSTDTV